MVSLGALVMTDTPVYAQSLQIQPLLYKENFKPGEVKKGFINVSNSGASTVTVITEVQAFKQIDNQGNLQFFDSKEVTEAIVPDLKEFQLQPREALRLYFSIDSKKLPGGDNFAALLTRTKGDAQNGIASNVRVGSLLVIQNGEPGPRNAEIKGISTSFFQWGKGAKAVVQVKNTADPNKTTAFFPIISASLKPFGSNIKIANPPASPLIFAGITRSVNIELPSNVIGIYRMDVSAGKNVESKWVFLITGFWRWVVVGLALLIPVFLLTIWLLRGRKRNAHYQSK